MYLYTSCNLYNYAFFCLLLLASVLNVHLVRGAIFPRVYYSGMPNSLKSGGCQIPCGDAKIPREFYSGMPNPLGCHIPCDTGILLSITIILEAVAMYGYRSLGSRLYTIVNGWLGIEKHVLETESNSLSERTIGNISASVVMSRFRKLKLARARKHATK